MKRLVILFAALLLSGCGAINAASTAANTNPSAQAIADARTAVLGVKATVGAAVIAADEWAQPANRCGLATALPAPLCNTPLGIIAVNKARIAAETVLLQASQTVLAASPSQSNLSLAISSAQSAWAAYQQVLTQYNIKTS